MVVEWLDANKLRAFDNRDALCLWLAVCAAGTPTYEMVCSHPHCNPAYPDRSPQRQNFCLYGDWLRPGQPGQHEPVRWRFLHAPSLLGRSEADKTEYRAGV